MSDNAISSFSNNSDLGKLSKLKHLDISGNKLSLSYDTYPKGLFKGLNDLQWLSLKNNTDGKQYPSITLSDLTSLKYLLIDGFDNKKFEEDFLKLKRLKHLDLSGLTEKCSISILTSQYFRYFPYLQTIDVSSCDLLRVENGTFRATRFLRNLDISYNEDLTFRVLSNITYDLQFTGIKVLKANKIYRTFGIGNELFVEDMKYLKNTSLERVYLDSNRLEILEPGVIGYLPNTLAYISVADNKFTMRLYILEIAQSSVRVFNGSYQGYSHNPFDILRPESTQSCDKPFRKNCNTVYPKQLDTIGSQQQTNNGTVYNQSFPINSIIFNVPKNLEKIYFRKCSLQYEVKGFIFTDNKISFLDFSGNFLYKLIGPFKNLNKLKYLDFSNNFCSHVSDFFFDNFVSLETLLIYDNLLGFVLNTDEGIIFKRLRHLTTLDISQNRIQSLRPNVFKGTPSLQQINISNNQLRDWDFDTRHLLHLKEIDFSNNQLGSLSAHVRETLDDLSKRQKITLNLRENNFVCDCFTVNFLKWMRKTNIKFIDFEHYRSRFSNGTIIKFQVLDEIISNLDIDCMSKLGLIIGTCISIVIALSIIIGGIVYRYRWKIRYLYYIARHKNRNYAPVGNTDSDRNFEYDIFVSYAVEDKDFVENDMVKNLEEDHNLRLCIHRRDFTPGIDIAANITNAIHNSRKTVVILSPDFLQSYWCRYEFNIARMEAIYSRDGKDILFLIFLRQISMKDLPLMMMDMIKSQSYIEYPDDPQGNVVFWEKIRKAVTL